MLSEDDRRRIEAEEVAAAHARQQAEASARGRLAAHAYRREVRAALRPRPVWWPVRWALPFVPVVALTVVLGLRPGPRADLADAARFSDGVGGITLSALLERCQQEVSAQRPGDGPLAFAPPTEAASDVLSGTDGRTWNGWARTPAGGRLEFTCSYTAADDTLHTELLEAP